MRSRIFPWKLISAARKFKLLCCPATVSSVLLQEFSQWFISSPFHPQVCPSHSPPGWSPSPSLVWLGQSWLSLGPNSPVCLGPVCTTRLGWSTQSFSFSSWSSDCNMLSRNSSIWMLYIWAHEVYMNI